MVDKVKDKFNVITSILSLIAVIMSGIAFVKGNQKPPVELTDVQYVMYLGLPEKNEDGTDFTDEQAKDLLETILVRHFSGYTIQNALGGWTEEDGAYDHENTLVIYLSDTDEESVKAAADELLKEFDQKTILIQTNLTVTEFYSGEKAKKE